jgi:hypothetical protein
MAQCMHGTSYTPGATVSGRNEEIAEGECAEKYGLHQTAVHWHSHKVAWPD